MKSVIAKATTGPNAELSATGMIDLGGGRKRYGMLQCGRDVNSEECKECGEAMLAKYPSCCQNRQGWQVVAPSCVIKYDDYKFYQSSSSPTSSNTEALIISISVSVVVAILCFCVYIFRRRKHVLRKSNYISESSLNTDLPTIPLMVIQQSTYHFSEESKLGEGGFGPVYKGTLPDGREIAVKRLSKTSGQGLEEFKNEVIFIAKLQHRNLVRLLGCCIEENEKILVYEYMANSSLDFHLFNEAKRKKLDWKQRLHIINGIARGLLYLHEDSRLRVIHRDLKASNVLLDHEMNPKISDFGLAKTFEGGESQGNTKRVMGTYGYMSPEYAMEGLFSVKSDVFSFGVLLLEIITGKRNSGFYLSEHGQSLLIYTWKLWCDGKYLELLDPVLEDTYIASDVLKCVHIGLLCVQEDAADRPTMSLVVVMLASDTMTLPNPKKPAFSVGRMTKDDSSTSKTSKDPSVNEVTVSHIVPR
ncbi:cysteine-rich receptor-like protein kinase 10 [Senna tora]|uniref:non-specific serine/threonine protein kinase n=1 Tax=Senna tora TaxID=362788 RepID=A0A834X166_9FABA|nr:cysteine-rich receptor-like protein kinase 10 [Senna tora]